MITHLVLLKPRPDLTASERRDFVRAFERAVQEIPGVRSVRVGRRVTCGAGYECGMLDAADFMAALDFDDVAGLQGYLGDPAHQELGRLFRESLASALVLDFEIAAPDSFG